MGVPLNNVIKTPICIMLSQYYCPSKSTVVKWWMMLYCVCLNENMLMCGMAEVWVSLCGLTHCILWLSQGADYWHTLLIIQKTVHMTRYGINWHKNSTQEEGWDQLILEWCTGGGWDQLILEWCIVRGMGTADMEWCTGREMGSADIGMVHS